MKLESLPNELLLNLFEYLNVIHLFPAFHGLNSRFDSLLFNHYRVYHVDFRSVSKHDFDIFCQQYLRSSVNRVVSLRLFDDEETPDLSGHFLRYGFTLNKFTHLKLLTLHDLQFETLNELIADFYHLSNLTHLKITMVTHLDRENNHHHNLINNIWSLPSLTHCHLDIMIFHERLQVTSSSIKYLFIKHLQISSSDLNDVFQHTPYLQHLSTTLKSDFNIVDPIVMAPSIMTLNISIDYSPRLLHKLFQNMPNLSHVTLEMTKSGTIILNGHQWKQIIVDYLPNIKKFRFFMRFRPSSDSNIEKKLDELLNTFRTPFWLDEHRWFVRCEWDPQRKFKNINLYTLPHCFGDCYVLDPAHQFKSTWPDDRNYRSYNRMYRILSEKEVANWPLSPGLFPKIDHLTIRISLPIRENVWSIIPIFDQLTSLEVSLHNRTGLSQLQVLLDRAPRLYSLSVDHLLASQLTQLNIIHARIRQLIAYSYCFNAPECSLLANSSLGRQCEILSIALTDRRNVPELINAMPNLRALTCYCEDNKWDIDESLSSSEKNILKWLQDTLPSTYSISKSLRWPVQIWCDK